MDAAGDTGALTNFVAITDPGTPLHRAAEDEGFHRVFLNPPDIGGRYSALSFFGLVPAAAIGMDVQELLESAAMVDREEAFELGARLGELAQQGRDKITFLAATGLESFGAWAEQLIAESTGKRGRGLIPIDGEPPGPPLTSTVTTASSCTSTARSTAMSWIARSRGWKRQDIP